MDQAATLRQLTGQKKTMPDTMQKEKSPHPKHKICVISITSGKGGVGKTNIAANLAYLLAGMKKKTLIFDADCGLANIDLILGLAPRYNLYHVLNGEKTLKETIISGPGGIKILPASSGIQEMTSLSMEQKLSLQDELNTLHPRPDFMLIDTSAGITENVMYFNMVATETIVVVTPEPTSLTDAYALIKVLYQRHAKKRFSLLVNMVKTQDEATEVFLRMAQATNHFLNLAIEHLGHVFYDENLLQAVKRQKLLAELYPGSPSIKCLQKVAEKLCQPAHEQENNGIISFFN
ncbi:MAG: MinD/ParA family protein [Deltaproteobacteria bacterium]|nr:MinD/ParA family protein [Deltaproteobacteria bacterium]